MKTCFFDLETKKLFEEVGGRYPEKLGLAVAGIIVNENKPELYTENDVFDLIKTLNSADLIIGHNVIGFDYSVLKPYADFDVLSRFKSKTLDTMVHIEKIVGIRLKLDSLARHTLGIGKTLSPIIIPALWKRGEHQKVKDYLVNDLKILKNLYDYGKQHGYVKCDINGRLTRINVNW